MEQSLEYSNKNRSKSQDDLMQKWLFWLSFQELWMLQGPETDPLLAAMPAEAAKGISV